VYTRFGGRTGLLDALYERAFDLMREQLLDVPPETEDGLADLLEVALAYRRFALENPARYALMYERSVHDFDPDPELRKAVMRTTFVMFVDKIRRISRPGADLQQLGYLLWTSMHGLVSVELTMRSQTPLSDWIIENTDEANEDVYRTGVRAMCTGLGLRT
jgi:AcrR family transcriptional regulator